MTTTEQFDIVSFIDDNPLVNMDKSYQSRLINKIKDKFNTDEQKIFIGSFYTYLNYDSKKDFVIDLQTVWKWIGFSRIDPAKQVLTKHFKKDIDYKIIIPAIAGIKKGRGGSVKHQILMSVNTFKKLCMKANTKKADEIHDYYVNLEEVLQETITEESEELKNKLETKDKELETKDKETKRIKYLYDRVVGQKKRQIYKRDNCVYVGINPLEKQCFKVGSTNDPNKREGTLSTGTLTDFEMKRIWYSKYYTEIEKITHLKFNESRLLNCKEFFEIDKFDEICGFITGLVNFLKDDGEDTYQDAEVYEEIKVEESKKVIKNPDLLPQKPCNRCKQIKRLEEYFDANEHIDGKENTCKVCVKERQQEYVEAKRKEEKIPTEKNCTSCKVLLPLEKFYKDKTKFDGVGTKCKQCFLKVKKESSKNKIIISEYKCKQCDTVKSMDNFGRNAKSVTGYKYTCKGCITKKAKERYHERVKKNIEEGVDITEEEKYKIRAERSKQRNKERLETKIICECGVETNLLGYKRHQKTKLHLKNMEKL